MGFVFKKLTVRRHKKGQFWGIKGIYYSSLENDVTATTVHKGWREEADRDSGATSMPVLKDEG